MGYGWNQSICFRLAPLVFGQAVALSSGSQRTNLVVGAPHTLNRQGDSRLTVGSVYYYELSDEQVNGVGWSRVGAVVRPPKQTALEVSGEFGAAVAINGLGNIIACGGTGTTRQRLVQVFQYNAIDMTWFQMGEDIFYESSGHVDEEALSLALSSDITLCLWVLVERKDTMARMVLMSMEQ